MPLQTCAECPLKAKHGKKITAYKGRAKAGTADYCEVPFRGPKTSVDVMIVGESPEPGEVGCGWGCWERCGKVACTKLFGAHHMQPIEI